MNKWSGDISQAGPAVKRIFGIVAFIALCLFLLSLILHVSQRCLNVNFC